MNCARVNPRPRVCANDRAASVLPRPGRSSISTCPPARMPASTSTSASRLPTTARSTSSSTCAARREASDALGLVVLGRAGSQCLDPVEEYVDLLQAHAGGRAAAAGPARPARARAAGRPGRGRPASSRRGAPSAAGRPGRGGAGAGTSPTSRASRCWATTRVSSASRGSSPGGRTGSVVGAVPPRHLAARPRRRGTATAWSRPRRR